MSKPAGKKRKIVYRDSPDTKAAQLEEFLFGTKGDAAQVFAKRGEESEEDDMTLTDLLSQQGAGALFFEDKDGQAAAYAFSDDSEQSDAEGDDEEGGPSSDAGGEGSQDEGEPSGSDAGEHGPQSGSEAEDDQAAKTGAGKPGGAGGRRAPAWADPADQQVLVDLAGKARLRKLRKNHKETQVDGAAYEAALRKQHKMLNPRTSWASLQRAQPKRKEAGSDEEGEDEEEEAAGLDSLLTQAGGLLSKRSGRLAPGSIETTRLKDANVADPSKAVVQSVGWQPSGQLLMTAGLDKKLRLFKVDGAENPLVQGVFLQDCPIQQACWASSGTQVVAAGRRPFFYLYDLASSSVSRVQPHLGGGCTMKSFETFAATSDSCSSSASGPMLAFCGDQGTIPLVSLKSRQWVANLKMSGSVRCAAWAPGGDQLLSLGGDGVIYTWDMRTRRCLSQARDYANVTPTALAISPDGQYVATGSQAGVVNVYSRGALLGPSAPQPDSLAAGCHASRPKPRPLLGGGVLQPQPLKEIMSLTTSVDSLSFSHDSQMLALSSRMKKDAMRLLHLPSCTVFSNWPTSRSPLHYVHSLAFSPHSGFLTVGNARGRALLYRLHHYQEA